jgi:signal transduction histidine kinase
VSTRVSPGTGAEPAALTFTPVDAGVAPAALSRAVLLGRAAVTVTAAGAGLFLVREPWRLVYLVGLVLVTSVLAVAVLSRWPQVVRWPVLIVIVDCAVLVAALTIGGPGIAYFSYSGGCAALAGALLGLRATPFWAAQATLGFAVAARFLADTRPTADVAVFVLAFPMAAVVAGIGAAGARTALARYVRTTVDLVAAAQRSAAASERARLARELHDSVTKTLRGVSFAALALPSFLRRHPDLVEQLAGTVSHGAEAAASQARELVVGLRLDNPDEDFVQTVAGIARAWSSSTGIAVQLDLSPVEPSIAVRYELTRILHEALVNVARHARAGRVVVTVGVRADGLRLVIADDGRGLPREPAGPASGHFGLVGMAERARAVGGELRVTSRPRAGTQVTVLVPGDARGRAAP